MQRGYVLSFRPNSGRGTIVTEQGSAFQFSTADLPDLYGGDVVSFQTGQGYPDEARDVHLVQRWPEAMPCAERSLVRELYRCLELGEPAC